MSERGQLTQQQVEQLLKPIKPSRVLSTQGQSYVAAWDVVAHLNRMFGFGGWDKEILTLDLVFESPEERTKGQKTWTAWTVCYRCTMRLTIFDPNGHVVAHREDGATGQGPAQPQRAEAHDLAMKNAISYAIKRCAKDLGDQFGLSLYNGGQKGAVVGRTLVMPDPVAEPGDVQADVPAPVSMGNDERQVPIEMVPAAVAKKELVEAFGGSTDDAKSLWAERFKAATEVPRWALDDVVAEARAVPA